MALKGQTQDNILLPSTGVCQNLWPVPSEVSQFSRPPPQLRKERARSAGVRFLCTGNTTGSGREGFGERPRRAPCGESRYADAKPHFLAP